MINQRTLGLGNVVRFAATSAFSGIYAFGDSLTDAGNIYAASGGLVPTSAIYSHGRFTNGRVWVQDVAKTLGLPAVQASLNGGTDYAYGGAETGQEPLHTVVPIDLPGQLAEFLVQAPHPSAHALYALSIGANDVIAAIPVYATNPSEAVSDIQAAVSNETAFVAGLAADGAKTFLIMNVPDLGLTPSESGNASTATSLSALYNQDLSVSLQALAAAEHLNIHSVDAFGLIDNAVAHPADYGLTNVTTPVWTGNLGDPFSGHLNAHGAAAQDHYLFFDHLHPTETGHLALAALAVNALK